MPYSRGVRDLPLTLYFRDWVQQQLRIHPDKSQAEIAKEVGISSPFLTDILYNGKGAGGKVAHYLRQKVAGGSWDRLDSLALEYCKREGFDVEPEEKTKLGERPEWKKLEAKARELAPEVEDHVWAAIRESSSLPIEVGPLNLANLAKMWRVDPDFQKLTVKPLALPSQKKSTAKKKR